MALFTKHIPLAIAKRRLTISQASEATPYIRAARLIEFPWQTLSRLPTIRADSMSESDSSQRPPDVPFPLQTEERVLQLVRRHWVHLWPKVLLQLLVAIALPALIAGLLTAVGAFDDTPAQIFAIIAGIYVLYWLVRIFLTWYTYHHDLWVITNQRIVDSLKRNPFHHRVSSADLVNVQDMTVERSGILQTALDYGNIVCKTAAAQDDFVLGGIPHPREVQALVDRERDRERLRGR
jgi:hypothetical protein